MDTNTMALILGISFGFGVVALAIGLILVTRNPQPTIALSTPMGTYKNEERWSVVKDGEGRVRDIIVHREATQT